ncbi:MAG: hypothetical protein J5I94_06585 [Phaeodactylibacter sp.]|nr:hypothetical protein [Phaeodactylibacter sp.]
MGNIVYFFQNGGFSETGKAGSGIEENKKNTGLAWNIILPERFFLISNFRMFPACFGDGFRYSARNLTLESGAADAFSSAETAAAALQAE